jgi:hypothetical protein
MARTDTVSGSRCDSARTEQTQETRLERGELITHEICPFLLPAGDDVRFLCRQELASRAHKNISFDPHTGKAAGFRWQSRDQADRLRYLLSYFSRQATAWLAATFPRYARHWLLDRVSFRPQEEATRKLRLKARNDLLHVDAFPSRPTNGRRILRLFVNINPTEPRVWVTSDPFAKLFATFGEAAGLPGDVHDTWLSQLGEKVRRLFRPNRERRSEYDSFMLRLHDYLKANDEFQERCRKRFWTFAPGSFWMAFTDTASHAVLRGRYALEHSYFIAPEDLALPDESPAAILDSRRACLPMKKAA